VWSFVWFIFPLVVIPISMTFDSCHGSGYPGDRSESAMKFPSYVRSSRMSSVSLE